MTALGQALLTVLIGVATFATGQIVVKLFDPIFELRSLFGEIARDLLLYENRDDRIAEPAFDISVFSRCFARKGSKGGLVSALFRCSGSSRLKTMLEQLPCYCSVFRIVR